MRQIARPGPSGLNRRRPVAAAKLPRGKSPQLSQPGLSASGRAPVGTPTSSINSCWLSLTRPDSRGAFCDQLLGLGDRFGQVEALRADVGAVHDRVAAVQAERVLEGVEPLSRGLVTAVDQPAIGL